MIICYRITGAKLDCIIDVVDNKVTSAPGFFWMVGQSLEGIKQWANRRGAVIEDVTPPVTLEEQLLLSYSAEAGAVMGADAIKGSNRKKGKPVFRVATAAETAALFTTAKAEHRYSDHWETVCPFCHEWVTSLFAQSVQTGLYMCKACYIAQGGSIKETEVNQNV